MPVLPAIRLNAGLHVSAMEASPDNCTDCVNFHSQNHRLKKRQGMVPVATVDSLYGADTPVLGWGTASAEPTTVASGDIITGNDSTSCDVYVGYPLKFNRFKVAGGVTGAVDATWTVAGAKVNPKNWDAATVQYWNGTAWTNVDCARISRAHSFYTADDVAAMHLGPWAYLTDGAAAPIVGDTQFHGVIDPPADWVYKTIAGQARFWLRLSGVRDTTFTGTVTPTLDHGESTVWQGENRVLCVLPFQDRHGTRHLFAVTRPYSDGKQLEFYLDGVVLMQSNGLSVDGNAKMFSDWTRVEAFYHAATDRVIGLVEGLGWFYLLPGNGWVYPLIPDQVAADTGYGSLLDGLRSAIPVGQVACLHEGRLFVADGQKVIWSSPGQYADIWPNANEAMLADANGNITAMVQAGGQLVVYKRNAIWVGQASGAEDGYIFYPVPGSIGCVARGSAVTIGSSALALAEDGVYEFNGQQAVRKVSSAVDEYVGTRAFSSGAERCAAVYHSTGSGYRLFHRSTAESRVLDAALYADMDSGMDEPTWWKQGKYASSDYGFQAVTVVADNTTDVNRILLGDRYGVIWEMDVGVRDGGSVVKSSLTSHRIGYGSSSRAIVRWVNPSQKDGGKYQWTVGLYDDGRKERRVTGTNYPHRASDGLCFNATEDAGGYTALETFAATPDRYTGQLPFSTAARFFQVDITDTNEAPLEVDAIEIEVNHVGRRRTP